MGLLTLLKRLALRLSGAPPDLTVLGWMTPWGVLDTLDLDPSGVIRIFGWSHHKSEDLRPPLLQVADTSVAVRRESTRRGISPAWLR